MKNLTVYHLIDGTLTGLQECVVSGGGLPPVLTVEGGLARGEPVQEHAQTPAGLNGRMMAGRPEWDLPPTRT